MYNRYSPQQGFEDVSSPSPASQEGSTGSDGLFSLLNSFLSGTKNAGRPGIFERLGLKQLETGDILLILILIFLYHESKDEEWLIILALILLMSLK